MKSIHMITQLTLSIKSELIAKAKVYAKANGTSVSKLVEDYFQTISTSETDAADLELSPGLRTLVGSVTLATDKSYKKIIAEYLDEKYQ